MKILIATTNQSKYKEISMVVLAEKPHLTPVSLWEMNITTHPIEDGLTFEENARIKAHYYADLAQLPALADDGGLQIDALNGEPGVRSRRWINGITDSTDEELINYTLEQMKDVPVGKRTARFITCSYFYNPFSKKEDFEQASIEGEISTHATTHWQPGYPYRALFIVKEFGKFYDELTPQEHSLINHRVQALRKLLARIGV